MKMTCQSNVMSSKIYSFLEKLTLSINKYYKEYIWCLHFTHQRRFFSILHFLTFLSNTQINGQLSARLPNSFQIWGNKETEPAITCSKLTIETLEQGVEYVHR